MGETHKIGISPWTREDYLSELKEFAEIYKNRPIKNNQGGMKAAQLFYAWFVTKKIQPTTIIESGVWYGQGTWFFEQAAPEAEIHCLDPVNYVDEEKGYKSPKAFYYAADFKDMDWTYIDTKNTLCFFDDHQDAMLRLARCAHWGFKRLMFEDNYPPEQGDCNSLKKVFHETETGIPLLLPGFSMRDYATHLIETYLEFPPISKLPHNRWGLPWDHYDIEESLLDGELEEYQRIYLEEAINYTWINYVELVDGPTEAVLGGAEIVVEQWLEQG